MPETTTIEVLNQVKTGLDEFEGFLTSDAFGQVKDAIKQVAARFPAIDTLIGQLISLMDQVETEIDNLDPGNALAQIPTFLQKVSELLGAAEQMFTPPPEIAETLEVVSSIAEVLQDIREVIPKIKTALTELKSA